MNDLVICCGDFNDKKEWPGFKFVLNYPECSYFDKVSYSEYDLKERAETLPEILEKFGGVVVNTHSSLYVDFVRLLVVKGQINPDNVKILFYKGDTVTEIKISDKGSFTSCPEGFFDMQEKVLAEILKSRKVQ
jgi:hypothetical protein